MGHKIIEKEKVCNIIWIIRDRETEKQRHTDRKRERDMGIFRRGKKKQKTW